MPNFEAAFAAKGFAVLQRFAFAQAPQNLRERAEVLAKQYKVAGEQLVKAMALQAKTDAEPEPLVLLMPSAERLDLKFISRVLGQEVDYFPQDRIESVFGAPMQSLSVLAAPERKLRVVADGRVFDMEEIVVSGGDALVDLQIESAALRSFLRDSLRIIDLESAKQRKGDVIEPRTLKGFRDYLPEEMLPRQAMIGTITQVFERFGFVPLQTPALEYSDILLGKLGADAEKLLFRFKDNGGRDVSMRYDLTVPLARVAAQYPELPKPFKRYQIAPVWRGENPGRGRFREFFQCDCDIVGSSSLLYDAECIALDFAVMQALGVNVEVRFSNRKVLSALGKSLGVADERQMMTISRTIDKIPAQGKDRVRELLKTDAACTPEQIEKIMRFVEIDGGNDEMLAKLSEQLGPLANEAVEELRRVKDFVGELTNGSPVSLKLDYSIARGLDYYTGTVYETFLLDLKGFGSVMSGGRYDNLIARYLGKPMPAVGISVGLDRLLAGLMELGRVKKTMATSRVMVVPMDVSCLAAALRVLGSFRAAGVSAEIALENDQKPKLDKQLSLAGKKGIPFAAILGSNEVAKGTLMLKDLNTREQEELTVAQAVAKF